METVAALSNPAAERATADETHALEAGRVRGWRLEAGRVHSRNWPNSKEILVNPHKESLDGCIARVATLGWRGCRLDGCIAEICQIVKKY